uniref:Uncharacterized protein n=1 Tax=viral metagenome TaxID=1070528 RepID=A0A6M3LMC1_9ZZZZ
MRVTKDYNTKREKQVIIQQMNLTGFTLVEEQLYFNGKHLIFDDGKPIVVRDPLAEIDDIKKTIAIIESKIAVAPIF